MLNEMNVNKNNNDKKSIIFLFFLIFFICGIIIYDDYGISIDEEFHRASGFYWLNYILQYIPRNEFTIYVESIYKSIEGFTLPEVTNHLRYGVFFDLPLAFLESLLNIEDSRNYFLIRHLFNFFIFYISSIFFFKILNERFNDWRFSLLGTAFFIFSPRIFANSFYNNKDIVFMSLLIIALFYTLKFIKEINYHNVFKLAFFSAACTSARIMGVSIILLVIFFFILSFISKPKENLKNIKFYLILITFFYIFLIIFWPYLWESPLHNFILALKEFSNYEHAPYLLYMSNFIKANLLPWHYSIIWIFITTPFLYIIFFLLGYFYLFYGLCNKFITLKSVNNNYDFWNSDNEKFDLLIFLLLTFSIFLVIKFQSTLYNGWRQLYFLHPLIIYISITSCRNLFFIFKEKLNFKLFFTFISIYLCFVSFQIFKMHPFQNVYFNFLAGKNVHLKYPIDYWGLSNSNFLNQVFLYNNNEEKINISVASHTPLFRSIKLLEKDRRDKFNIVGQEYKNSDYIYTNFMSEVNKNIDKKYEIPNNFKLFDEFYVADIKVYEVYKKLDD